MQKQPRLGNFLDSAYDFGKNNKNKKWFKEAISQMGLKEKWITKDQSNNRLVKILLFFGLLLLIIANILVVKCYKGSMEMKKPSWNMNNGNIKSKFEASRLTLRPKMFRVGDFWLDIRVIIKILTQPCYPRTFDQFSWG